MKIEDYLKRSATLYPNKIAVITDAEQCTYAELYQRTYLRASELSETSDKRIIVFRASQTIDFLVEYFAIHLAGCVAVPLEKDIPEDRFLFVSQLFKVATVPDNIADVLFTTGTTGIPKGVMISHEAIIANAENLIDAQQFSHDLIFIITGPLSHIGSLSKVYPIIIQGATLYLTKGMKDINQFFHALDHPTQKMATFLVPSAIRMLLILSADSLAKYAKKIVFIETGAAPIAQSEMQLLRKLLPHSSLYNTYASTETGIVCTQDFNTGMYDAGCVGLPMRHASIEISDQGMIICKGKMIMSGYINDITATKKVLCNGCIHTSDLGWLDEHGQLHLAGRKDDIINVGGFKVSPTEVENVALSLPEIVDCICISVPHSLLGNHLKLLVVLHTGKVLDKKRLAQFLKSKLESFKVPMLYQQVDNIKKTSNGKTDRKYYNTP